MSILGTPMNHLPKDFHRVFVEIVADRLLHLRGIFSLFDDFFFSFYPTILSEELEFKS